MSSSLCCSSAAVDDVKHEPAAVQHVTPIAMITTIEGDSQSITVQGWISKMAVFKKHAILQVRDNAGQASSMQVIVGKGPALDVVATTNVESYVRITGDLRQLPAGKYSPSGQSFELHGSVVECLSGAEPDFANRCPPGAGPDVRLNERHMLLRSSPEFAVTTRLRALLIKALRTTFEDSMGCTELVPPCFVGNQCEGGATLFKVAYPPAQRGPDIEAYLTQSSQFYLEMAVPAIGNCYCIYPSFRSERSHTRRHLTEFLHAECEWKDVMTFSQHLERIKCLITDTLRHLLDLDKPLKLLEQLGRRDAVEALAKLPIVEMTHAEAIAYCREHGIYADEETQTHFAPDDDIPEAQERRIIDQLGAIVLWTHFPRKHKSFYMQTDPENDQVVWGCDVEVPGVGEIVGSGVRVRTVDGLRARLKEQGLKEEDYREYIDLRRYGYSNTSGMGLGVDRMLCWLLDVPNIRDVVTFPRVPGRLTP